MDTMTSIRPERAYTLYLEAEGGGEETVEITVPQGTEEEQDQQAIRQADQEAAAWMRGGEWGEDGASVACWITMEDEESEWTRRCIQVEIEPAHDALIAAAVRAAGRSARGRSCGDVPNDHDWTSEGEGGCRENPGVWSTGGTSMMFRSHCRVCGLIRVERVTGPQRNPGDHDTVEYEMPDEIPVE